MSVSNKQGWDYINTATDVKVGNGLKQGATYGQADLAGAKTDIPLGVSVEDVAKAPAATGPFGVVSVETGCGAQVKMVASAAIAINVVVTSAANGQFVTAAKALDTATANWAWGRSLEAASNAADVFAGIFNWFEMQIA